MKVSIFYEPVFLRDFISFHHFLPSFIKAKLLIYPF